MRHFANRVVFVSIFLLAAIARAEVQPNHLFSDHMVLQNGVSVPVWGTAAPGEQVTVTLGDQKQTAAAGPDGKWMIHLSSLKSGGPVEMNIAGSNSITIHDVLVGEVWVGSGQSNMVFSVSDSPTVKAYNGVTNKEQEVAAANYPLIRMYIIPEVASGEPKDDTNAKWQVCTPDNVKAFSAIGYFFARDLHKELNVPVGFIRCAYGASTAEAWVAKPDMEANPKLAGLMKTFQTALNAYTARGAAPTASPAVAPTPVATTQPTTRGARGRGRGAPRGPQNPSLNQHNPTVLWNAMLHPIEPYAMRGVIWYQGESVLGGTAGDKLYPTVMETLVTSWRRQWGQGDFPFYVCQLAGLDNNSNNPTIRESQAAVLSLPNTGLAVTIDIGEQKFVHPKDKQDVGDRLSRIALANVYGKTIEYSGPAYQSMNVEGSSIRVKFTHIGGGLVAKGGDLKTFVIAGPDGKFVPATAKIDGDTIVVSSADVTQPTAVRYAWSNWPEGCNLYNVAGLPAAPFRTDKD